MKRREPNSMASRNLDPDCLVFNTATPDLDQHPPPFRMGAEMARGSESAFLICTPKPRLCRGLHPNGTIAPMDLDRSTNGSNFERPTAIQI